MSVHRLLLELPPQAKGRPKFGKGFTYTPKKTREYEAQVRELAKGQYWHQPLEGAIKIHIDFIMPRPKSLPRATDWHIKRPDCDNLQKAIFDALNGICWEDDSQLCDIRARKMYTLDGLSPRVLLEFSLI